MKIRFVILLTTILVCLSFMSCTENSDQQANQEDGELKVEAFVLKESRWCLGAMEDAPSEKVVGPVLTAEEAVEKAVDIWLEIYGEKIKKQAPYRVFYDEAEDIWYIRGADLPENMKGGYAEILIERSTGRVLAVWHSS